MNKNNVILYPFSKQLMFAKVMEDADLCRDMLGLIFPDRENGVASIRKAYCKELLPQPVHRRKPAMNRLREMSRRVPRAEALHS